MVGFFASHYLPSWVPEFFVHPFGGRVVGGEGALALGTLAGGLRAGCLPLLVDGGIICLVVSSRSHCLLWKFASRASVNAVTCSARFCMMKVNASNLSVNVFVVEFVSIEDAHELDSACSV